MNRQLSYRTVEPDDLRKICRFPQSEEELFFMFPKAEYPLTVSQLETAVNNRFDSMVILLNDEVVGFANFYEVVENKHCCIGNVIVSPTHRNKGIAKYLVQVMEQIAIKKYKVPELHLSCFNTNTNGILLYSKLGYIPYKIEKLTDKQNEPKALIEMKKEI